MQEKLNSRELQTWMLNLLSEENISLMPVTVSLVIVQKAANPSLVVCRL